MFSTIKSRVFGSRLLLLYCLSLFQNRFFAVADDQKCAPAFRYGREDGSLITEGATSAGAMKNLIAVIHYPFNDSVSGAKKVLHGYGRTTPVGDAIYATLPIGSIFDVYGVDGSGNVTSYTRFHKETSGSTAAAWKQVLTSASAPTYITFAAGTMVSAGGDAVETITVTGCTITDLAFVEVCSIGTSARYVTAADTTTAAGFVTVTLSGDPYTSTKLAYKVIRPIANY